MLHDFSLIFTASSLAGYHGLYNSIHGISLTIVVNNRRYMYYKNVRNYSCISIAP